MTTKEIYFSCDVEADGPIPGEYSMLSFGAAAFLENGEMVSTFTENLLPLPGAKQHPDTMAWWRQAKQKAAWDACHKDQKDPEAVMKQFAFWVTGISEPRLCKPVFVGYPVSFDWLFLYWYLIKFAGRSPFEPSYSGLDLESYAMRALGIPYTEIKTDRLPDEWKPKTKNERPHVALADAIEQGELFINMLRSGR